MQTLVKHLGAVRFSPSDEFKHDVCRKHGLDYGRIADRAYKEKHRHLLITEFQNLEEERQYDKQILDKMKSEKRARIALIDVRLRDQVQFYKQHLPRAPLVRIDASDEVRATRGFVFTNGVDDNTTETELDLYEYDATFQNDNAGEDDVIKFVNDLLKG